MVQQENNISDISITVNTTSDGTVDNVILSRPLQLYIYRQRTTALSYLTDFTQLSTIFDAPFSNILEFIINKEDQQYVTRPDYIAKRDEAIWRILGTGIL